MKLDTEQLKAIRKKQKLTIQELAQKAGITRNTLSAWENELRIPSEAKIRMLAKVLNVTADKISDLEPEAPVSPVRKDY